MSATPELRALTAARGIAAWWVVLYHIRGAMAGLPPLAEAVLGHGYLAVDFFFLLSGFVLALSHGARLRDGGWAAVPDFLHRRVARIWPLHAAMLGFALLLLLALQLTGRAAPEFPLAQLPAHLLLVQGWGWTDPLCWNDPAWSISCEMAAYLAFATVLALAPRPFRSRLGAGVALASVVGLLGTLHLIYAGHGAASLGTDIARLGIVRCLLEFAAGTALYTLWQHWRARWRSAALRCALLVLLLGLGGLFLPESLVVPPALAALLLALALTSGRPRNPLEGTLLHRLGTISYATYLAHYLLWYAFKLVYLHGETLSWLLIALYLATVLLASGTLHDRVERPAQRWMLAIRPSRKPLPVPRSPRG